MNRARMLHGIGTVLIGFFIYFYAGSMFSFFAKLYVAFAAKVRHAADVVPEQQARYVNGALVRAELLRLIPPLLLLAAFCYASTLHATIPQVGWILFVAVLAFRARRLFEMMLWLRNPKRPLENPEIREQVMSRYASSVAS